MTEPQKKRKSALAKKLAALRVRLDLTQAEAAERIGVSTRTLISWENDQRRPGRIAKKMLAQAFPDDFS